ncbi:MAG: replicative DNA helicase [Desulfobacterales bacterium]|nr:MAG: replicative DNA helicase [Desulfobacterales bacterium]
MKRNKKESHKDHLLYRLPPQSIEAEASLFSAILIDNRVLNEVIEILRPSDFYKSAHQKIFETIIDLFEKNEPVDLATLANRLNDRGILEEVGGGTYLAKLVNEVPLAVNAKHYANIIHDKASLRGLIERSNAIIKRCLEDQENVDEIIDFAERCIFEISEKKIKPSFYKVTELVDGAFDVVEKRQKTKGMPTGVATGFTELDRLTLGFQNSDLIILAARPSMGKTAMALNIARNAAVDGKIPVAIFSLEMAKEQLVLRLLWAESRVSSDRLRDGFMSDRDWKKLHQAGARLYEAPIYIDDSPENSALSIRAKTRRLKMEQNVGLVIIDYLQLMKIVRTSERRDLDISEISRSLKALARELEIPVVALSQLNRQLERRDDKRPRLSDLRESGALEQDADVVAFIHREDAFKKKGEIQPDDGKAELIVAKQRNGPTGSVPLAFLKSYLRFENLAPEDS